MKTVVVKVWRVCVRGLLIMGQSVMTMNGYAVTVFMTDDLRYDMWLYEHRPTEPR